MELRIRNIVFWIIVLAALSTGNTVFAQGDKNPFDLNSGQQKEVRPTNNESTNPFDIKHQEKNKPVTIDKEVKSSKTKPKSKDMKNDRFKNFLFFLMFFAFLVFSTVSIIFKDLLKKVFNAFSNERLLNLLHGEKTVVRMPLLVLFLLIYALNAGVFVLLTIERLVGINDENYFALLLTSIVAVIVPFFIKYIILKVIGNIFSIQKEVNAYLFTIYIFFIVIGVFLFPVNIFIGYGIDSLKTFLIYFTFFVLALVLIFRLIRGLFIGMRLMSLHIFHFLLYLCAVEIVPSLILVKIIMRYFS